MIKFKVQRSRLNGKRSRGLEAPQKPPHIVVEAGRKRIHLPPPQGGFKVQGLRFKVQSSKEKGVAAPNQRLEQPSHPLFSVFQRTAAARRRQANRPGKSIVAQNGALSRDDIEMPRILGIRIDGGEERSPGLR